jgi:hypothetical protein
MPGPEPDLERLRVFVVDKLIPMVDEEQRDGAVVELIDTILGYAVGSLMGAGHTEDYVRETVESVLLGIREIRKPRLVT